MSPLRNVASQGPTNPFACQFHACRGTRAMNARRFTVFSSACGWLARATDLKIGARLGAAMAIPSGADDRRVHHGSVVLAAIPRSHGHRCSGEQRLRTLLDAGCIV